MTKRFFAALVVAALAMTMTSLVVAPAADAGNDCTLGPVLFDRFEDGTEIVTAEYILADFENDRAEIIAIINEIIAEGEADQFDRDFLAWLLRGPCEPKIAYNGPFTNHPPAPTGAYGWGAPNVVAAAAPAAVATGGGDAAAPLAHTGLDTAIPGMLGATMLGAGLLIEGGRRRRKNA